VLRNLEPTLRVESGELPREKTLEELPSVIFVRLQTHDKSITPTSG
jgi:hypothetical protein